jgi:hypothetical protein
VSRRTISIPPQLAFLPQLAGLGSASIFFAACRTGVGASDRVMA